MGHGLMAGLREECLPLQVELHKYVDPTDLIFKNCTCTCYQQAKHSFVHTCMYMIISTLHIHLVAHLHSHFTSVTHSPAIYRSMYAGCYCCYWPICFVPCCFVLLWTCWIPRLKARCYPCCMWKHCYCFY